MVGNPGISSFLLAETGGVFVFFFRTTLSTCQSPQVSLWVSHNTELPWGMINVKEKSRELDVNPGFDTRTLNNRERDS
jgi:hypothetical protein